MVLVLQQCCCGCSLKIGTVVIGILFAFMSGILLLGCTVNALATTAEIQHTKKSMASSKKIDDQILVLSITRGMYIVLGVICAVQVIINVVLLIGATKDNRKLVYPWVVFYSALVSIGAFIYVIGAVVKMLSGNVSQGVATIALLLLVVSLAVYSILVVHSLYRELKEIRVAISLIEIDGGYPKRPRHRSMQ